MKVAGVVVAAAEDGGNPVVDSAPVRVGDVWLVFCVVFSLPTLLEQPICEPIRATCRKVSGLEIMD